MLKTKKNPNEAYNAKTGSFGIKNILQRRNYKKKESK